VHNERPEVLRAIEFLESGVSSFYVREGLLKEFRNLRDNEHLDNIMSMANTAITDKCFSNIKELHSIHMARYNAIIDELIGTEELDPAKIIDETTSYVDENGDIAYEGEYTWSQWYDSRLKKIRNYYECLEAMYQKEEVLQFHRRDFVLELNEVVNEVTVEKKQAVNLNKLTYEEQLEMYNFVKKARLGDNVLAGITENVSENVVVTEDIKHEVVLLPSNASLIEHKEIPPVKKVSPNTASDPTAALRKNLMKIITQEYKDAGIKLDDEEKKHLE